MELKILTWQKILISLLKEQRNISQIALDIRATNQACSKNMKLLEERKLVTSKKNGRNKIIKITPKGKEIADSLSDLYEKEVKK